MTDKIRVSVASFARIKHGDKIFLLRHAGNWHRKNKLMFMPIGGGLQTKPAMEQWLNDHDVTWDKKGELRFRISRDFLEEFEKQFENKSIREYGVSRETFEELVLEENLVIFKESDIKQTYSHTYKTFHQIDDFPITRYIFEVFDVTLPPDVMYDLASFAEYNDQKIILVTPTDILKGKTSFGIEIGDSTRALVTDKPINNWDSYGNEI